MVTFFQQIEQVRGTLSQFTTNRPQLATFTGWTGPDPETPSGIGIAGAGQKITNALVEVGHELVHVTSHDPASSVTVCQPWFRAQQGSARNDDYPVGSVLVINPQWPTWHVAQTVVSATANLYPSLFVPKTVQLTSANQTERYLLPDDVDEIVAIKYEDYGPVRSQRTISRWSLDTKAIDGHRYLHITEVQISGRPIYITYRAKPILPVVGTDSEWSATGLPDTASDLPVLWAVAQLMPAADAAKTQTVSVEQSERNRFVQPNSANSTSRRYQDLYAIRLNEEKRKMLDRFPPKMHRTIN